MRVGVVFPQTEIGADAGAVRAYGEGVAELGFTHVLAYDHVLGADPAVHQPWTGPYDVHTTFHEPMVLYGYLAALTSLELVTGIIILPQRQTALAAKQAAEVDLLTGGRLRFGVGLGWNAVEYEALGKDFTTRGRRLEEQVTLLRRLWTEPSGGMHAFQRLQAMTSEIAYHHVETNYTLALAELSTRLRRRSLVVLFTDFLDTVTAELMIDNVTRLARRHLVLFVAVAALGEGAQAVYVRTSGSGSMLLKLRRTE